MKRILKLTENDITRLVKKIINEQSEENSEVLNVGNVSLTIGDRILIAGSNPTNMFLGNISDLVINNDIVTMKIKGFFTSIENITFANKTGKEVIDYKIGKNCLYIKFDKPYKIFTQQVASENIPTIQVNHFDKSYFLMNSNSNC